MDKGIDAVRHHLDDMAGHIPQNQEFLTRLDVVEGDDFSDLS